MSSSRVRHLMPFVAVLVSAAIAVSGCSSGAHPESDSVSVVATTTMLGDLAHNIVRDAASVEVLLPVGADPHDYQASSQQVALILQADLVIANGLGLEEGLEDVLDAAQSDGANIVYVAGRLDPIPFGDIDNGHDDDPHVWLDPLRMAEAGRIVAAELSAVRPATDWAEPSEAYVAELEATDREIVQILADIPDDRRKLATNHSSLGYFADRYGFEIVGTVVPGGSTLGDPSSAELAALIAQLESTLR